MHFYCERLLVAINQDEGSEGLNQRGVENLAGGPNRPSTRTLVYYHTKEGQSTLLYVYVDARLTSLKSAVK